MTKAKAEPNPYFDRRPSGKKGGRPRLILNDAGKEKVEDLASIGCTKEEIATELGVSVDTLGTEDNKEVFTESARRGKESGKTSVRRALFRQMERGDVRATIFLAKNILGMSDGPRVEVSVEQRNEIRTADTLTYDEFVELIREGRIRSGADSEAHVR